MCIAVLTDDELEGEESDTASIVPSESEGEALGKAKPVFERIQSTFTFLQNSMTLWTICSDYLYHAFHHKISTGSELFLAGFILDHIL